TGVGEGVATAGRDIGLQVRLGFPEFVEEPVLLDIDLVEVVINKTLEESSAHVSHFQRRAAVERALPARSVRLRVRHLEVRLEGIDLVGNDPGVRIDRRFLERGSAKAAWLTGQQR